MRPMFLKKAADMRFKAADVKAADGVLRRPMFEKRPMDVVEQPTHQYGLVFGLRGSDLTK